VARQGGGSGRPALTLDCTLREFRQAVIDLAESWSAPDIPGPDAPTGAGRRLRLLAAEDNKTNQMIFRKMIKALDLDLTLADNGRAALAAYREQRPDILFTDISMPEMDGLDLTREIRRIEEAEGADRLPIVAMTAHAMDDHEAEIFAAGVDHYLTKPLKKDQIIGKITSHVPEGVLPVLPE